MRVVTSITISNVLQDATRERAGSTIIKILKIVLLHQTLRLMLLGALVLTLWMLS